MSKFSPPQPEESVSVNVVPLVDIMFLLLLFLMIGGDMSHRESTELVLPQADKAVEADREAKDERYAVINIHPLNDTLSPVDPAYRELSNWAFAISGNDYTNYFELVDGVPGDDKRPGLRAIGASDLEDTPIPGISPPKFLSKMKISIRADKTAPYAMIQLAMQACAASDLYKIEVGAAKPAPR